MQLKIKGFTLIELIVVIGIISILAIGVIAILNPFSQFQKATDSRKKSDLAQIQRALEVYYQDNGHYPPNALNCKYEIQGNNGDGNDCIEWGSSWQPYMNIVPQDPSYPTDTYIYYTPPLSNGQTYYLYANLGRGALDLQACNGGNPCNSLSVNGINSTQCGGVCNYGVSSPNTAP